MIERSIVITAKQQLDNERLFEQTLCVEIDSAWLLRFPWMGTRRCVLFRARLMARNSWTLSYTTWYVLLVYLSLTFVLTSSATAPQNESLPAGQEHPDPQQLCNSQDKCPSRDRRRLRLCPLVFATLFTGFQSHRGEFQLRLVSALLEGRCD